MKPNVVVYTLVIKACCQAKDIKRAEKVLERMEKSDTPPDTRTYSEFLEHWSKIGTAAAAERAERLLAHMKWAKNPRIKPNAFCYRSVMTAVALGGKRHVYERIWNLYEEMQLENVYPDAAVFNTMINHFSLSPEPKYLKKAESLIEAMENTLGDQV